MCGLLDGEGVVLLWVAVALSCIGVEAPGYAVESWTKLKPQREKGFRRISTLEFKLHIPS
jgi:hypothetical protein